MKKQTVIKSTVAGILAVGAGIAVQNALAGVPNAPANWEKCYGVSKAGKNDCGASDGSHRCGGMAKEDDMETEWIWVPEGTCLKLTGGVVGKVAPSK